MLRTNRAAWWRHGHGTLEFVAQLADIAWPPVLRKQVEHVGTELQVWLAETVRRFAQEEGRQVRDLFASLSQRRHVDADHAETVVEIFAELAFGHALLEVGVGGRKHSHVDRLGTVFADRHDLALLEKSQQLRLDVQRQVADFIEEQRAAGGRANQAGLIRDRAGK